MIDSVGEVVADRVPVSEYRTLVGEASNVDSYLKSPYFKPAVKDDGPITDGIYRVGPLARVNMADAMGSPLADAAQAAFKERAGGIAASSFFFHYARLVEVLACTEQMRTLLEHPDVTGAMVRASGGVNHRRAVGASEAPRGTLFHEYHVDSNGILDDVNMIIATGQNNLAMNATVHQIAKEWIDGPEIPEGILNRVEAGIRAFDPCLSCSTHAIGQMPLVVTLVGPDGETVCERIRG